MPQLRGERLRARIAEVVNDLARQCEADGRKYVFNASDVARRVPTTRKSLARADEAVSEILQQLYARRRKVNGDASFAKLREEIVRLSRKAEDDQRLIEQLRRNHIAIFSALRGSSVNMGEIILCIRKYCNEPMPETCPACGYCTVPLDSLQQ